jgi:hypothetical protein
MIRVLLLLHVKQLHRSIARSVRLKPHLDQLEQSGGSALTAGSKVEVVNLGDQRFGQARPDPLQFIRLGRLVR